MAASRLQKIINGSLSEVLVVNETRVWVANHEAYLWVNFESSC